jgi:hypothetical protein
MFARIRKSLRLGRFCVEARRILTNMSYIPIDNEYERVTQCYILAECNPGVV